MPIILLYCFIIVFYNKLFIQRDKFVFIFYLCLFIWLKFAPEYTQYTFSWWCVNVIQFIVNVGLFMPILIKLSPELDNEPNFEKQMHNLEIGKKSYLLWAITPQDCAIYNNNGAVLLKFNPNSNEINVVTESVNSNTVNYPKYVEYKIYKNGNVKIIRYHENLPANIPFLQSE